MTSPLAHLGEIRTRGWKVLSELVRGKDAAQAIAAEKSWARDLVTAVRPFNEVWAIKLGTLGPLGPGEDILRLRYLRKVTDKRHGAAIYRHAVRLRRLDKLLDEIGDGTVAVPTRAAWEKAFAKPLAQKPAAEAVRKPASRAAIEKWLRGFLIDGKPNMVMTEAAAQKHFYPKVVLRPTLRPLHRKIKAEQTKTPSQ